MTRRSVTSAEVAHSAGVSQSAVSRAFTPNGAVSDDTRRKVLEAARKLGYTPNAMARTLITNRSRIIGVVVSYLENQFYPTFLERLSKQLRLHGYHVLLFCTDTRDSDALLAEILQYRVDGIILASTNLSSPVSQSCAQAGIPVVLFNRTSLDSASSTVTTDNVMGGRMVAAFLCGGQHQRLSFIAGIEDTSTSRDREQGFMEGLSERGQPCFSRAVGDYRADGAAQAALSLFAAKTKPDAVFVANDHMAIAVMDALRQVLLLRIPQDVSVVGFDDVPQTAWGSYRLTTVRQPLDRMIEATVALLMRQIASKTARTEHIVLPAELIIRASARIADHPR